jgi:hypothetical protein
MPRDLFKENGITADNPRDLFAENNIHPSQSMQSVLNDIGMKRPSNEDVINTLKGMAQGAANAGIGYANLAPGVSGLGNLFPGGEIPKLNFAGNNPEAEKGNMLSEIGSYFLPGAAFKGANVLKRLQSRPILNAIAKLVGAGGEGALSGAILSPSKEHQGENALIGGGIGTGANAIAQLIRNKNPLINLLARGLVGGGLGAASSQFTGYNPYASAGAGATAASLTPKLTKAMGLSGGAPGLETLEHLNESEILPALQAGNRLRTPITPAEASGNPFVGKLEGNYGRTSQAAAEKTRIGTERVNAQKSAINDLLDTIYDKSSPEASALSQKKIKDLYIQANKWSLKPNVVNQFKEDPVIEQAFKKVQNDPAYQRKLKGVPETNYAYLNQVKRALDDFEGAALKSGEKTRAAEYKEAKNQLLDTMDESVPAYKAARQEAQKSIIRSNISKAMSKKEIKGSNFYNTILKNEDQFKQLHDSLKNVPEAQAKLKDMRLAWKDLINLEKPRSASYTAEKGLDQSRARASELLNLWYEMTGSKRNLQALKFINSGEWDKSFAKIRQIKDESKRMDELASLFARLTTASKTSNQ